MSKTDFTDKEIMDALIFCKHSDGALCNICAYGKLAGGICSKTLLTDASERIGELLKENKKLKEKEQ